MCNILGAMTSSRLPKSAPRRAHETTGVATVRSGAHGARLGVGASSKWWLGWVAIATTLPGCAPGEEVSELRVVEGKTKTATVRVNAGEEIHFWEDFAYHRAGKDGRSGHEECFQWQITSRRKGDDKTSLKCWAFDGSRCDVTGTNERENCKIPDCVIKVKQSGELEISAKLEPVRECGLKAGSVKSVLRVRRVQ